MKQWSVRRSNRALGAWTSIPLMCAVLFVANTPVARAAGVVGTGTADSCTEAALDAALAGGGLVTFDCGPEVVTITLTQQKDISSDTTVDGGGLITLDGNHAVRVFSVAQGHALSVENLTILNGSGFCSAAADRNGDGGAIYNAGTLAVIASTFAGNNVHSTCGGIACCGEPYGGAIYSSGTLTVTNSTFTGNNAHALCTAYTCSTSAFGGAIYNAGTFTLNNSSFDDNSVSAGCATGSCAGSDGGAIYNVGTLGVTNSTFAGNSASAGCTGGTSELPRTCGSPFGGAIYNAAALTVTNSTFARNSIARDSCAGLRCGGARGAAIFNPGTVTVTNSTFAGNSATNGIGAIYNGGALTMTNSIVANGAGGNCAGAITDGGHNIDDGTTCGFSTQTGSLSNADPQLDPMGLQDNGGPTQTVALCMGVDDPAGCSAASLRLTPAMMRSAPPHR